jgi:hypothetical protein
LWKPPAGCPLPAGWALRESPDRLLGCTDCSLLAASTFLPACCLLPPHRFLPGAVFSPTLDTQWPCARACLQGGRAAKPGQEPDAPAQAPRQQLTHHRRHLLLLQAPHVRHPLSCAAAATCLHLPVNAWRHLSLPLVLPAQLTAADTV